MKSETEDHRADLRVDIPETESLVPRTGQRKLSIRGNDDIRNEVRVALERATRITVLAFFPGQLPHDDALICTIGLLNGSSRHLQFIAYHGTQTRPYREPQG